MTGPHSTVTRASFRDVVAQVSECGCEPFDISPEAGTFRVRSHWATAAGEHVVFQVRAFEEGWLQTVPTGDLVQRRGTRLLVPKPVDRELIELAMALGAAMDGEEGS